MKSVLVLSVALVGTQAFAAEGVLKSDSLFPYIAPQNCLAGMRSPPNSNGVMMSKTCEYAFVLPSATGVEKLSEFSASSNIIYCKEVLANLETVAKYRKMLLANLARIDALLAKNPSDPAIALLYQFNEQNNKMIEALSQQYAAVVGGNLNISLDGTTSDSVMSQWRDANSQLIELKGTVFTKAPISQGYLSFEAVNATEEDKKSDPIVLNSSIPGFKNGQGSTDVIFGGHLEGQVRLSLKGACGILTTTDFTLPNDAKLDERKAASNLVVNYTYAVPVQTGVSYTAGIKAKEISNVLQQVSTLHGQFSVESLMKSNVSDAQTSLCEVNYKEYELPPESSIKQKFETSFTSTICTTLLSTALDKLAAKGVLSQTQEEFKALPSDTGGGNVSTTQHRQNCHIGIGAFRNSKGWVWRRNLHDSVLGQWTGLKSRRARDRGRIHDGAKG